MSRTVYIIISFVVAILTTVIGWSQTLIYKEAPPGPIALWFPFVVITDAHDLEAVALSLIQFPLLAIAFSVGIRRWRVSRVIAALVLTYALFAGIAFAIVRSR